MPDNAKLEFGMTCEFRNPPQWRRPFLDCYHEAIDHIVWAEQLGYDAVYLTEHHFTDDDYLPSPLMTATVLSQKTNRIRISGAVLLLPLYHPVRLAEDGAFIDLLSNGRYELGFGIGYRREEYAGYGVEWKTRGERTDEMVQIIRRLWEEDNVTFHGKHFQLDNVSIRPKALQQPRPPILIGGAARAATRRAARWGDGLLILDLENQYTDYVEELAAVGKSPSDGGTHGGHYWMYVSDDPERTWDALAPYAIYHLDQYAKWGFPHPPMKTKEELRASGMLQVVTPEQMIETIRELAPRINLKRYMFFMNPGGAPFDVMREPIETFATKVIPAFR